MSAPTADAAAFTLTASGSQTRASSSSIENSWTNEQCKGINSRWRVPGNGQLFEVQFHTRASLDAKEETHWAYEKLRITATVPAPPGATEIPDYP